MNMPLGPPETLNETGAGFVSFGSSEGADTKPAIKKPTPAAPATPALMANTLTNIDAVSPLSTSA